MRKRAERFGAWLALDDGSLVAVDRARARALAIEGGPLWDDASVAPPPHPLEAHVAVTSKCPVACSGCYQDASPRGEPVAEERILASLDKLAAMGVFTVAFGGGEPITRSDLGAIAMAARARGIVPVVTTSGIGLDDDAIEALRAFAQVNVSHDGVGGSYRDVRGFDGANQADRAIVRCVAAGIRVGVNFVLTRESFAAVHATAAHVAELGACEIQLLRYKPAGRAASVDYLSKRLTPDQVDAFPAVVETLSHTHAGRLSVRIDCALTPFLADRIADVATLEQWGIFGCEAGRHLTAVSREGALGPCSFMPHAEPDAPWAWDTDARLERFRAFAADPPEPCARCAIASVCRGGCKVVSEHVAGAFVPDPECPRVRAHRADR